jgi:hypothetical protein
MLITSVGLIQFTIFIKIRLLRERKDTELQEKIFRNNRTH